MCNTVVFDSHLDYNVNIPEKLHEIRTEMFFFLHHFSTHTPSHPNTHTHIPLLKNVRQYRKITILLCYYTTTACISLVLKVN